MDISTAFKKFSGKVPINFENSAYNMDSLRGWILLGALYSRWKTSFQLSYLDWMNMKIWMKFSWKLDFSWHYNLKNLMTTDYFQLELKNVHEIFNSNVKIFVIFSKSNVIFLDIFYNSYFRVSTTFSNWNVRIFIILSLNGQIYKIFVLKFFFYIFSNSIVKTFMTAFTINFLQQIYNFSVMLCEITQ